MNEHKKNSSAKIAANNKYNQKTYRKVTVNFRNEEFAEFDQYLQDHDIKSKNSFILEAIKEKMTQK